jgi:uncharacterized protein (TIGR02594 family)
MTKLIEAGRKYLGQREVPGPGVSAWIQKLWADLPGGKWFWTHYGEDDSKLPWCGAFMARVCKDVGLDHPKQYASAASWGAWGEKVSGPHMGAVAVLTRAGGGHVGIVTGVTAKGDMVRLLGGNQGDAVSEVWFPVGRITHYRKPAGATLPLAEVATVTAMSRSEA